MTENQKNQPVTGNQGGKQNQGQRKEGASTEKLSSVIAKQGKQPDKKQQNQGGNQNKNQKGNQGSDKRR